MDSTCDRMKAVVAGLGYTSNETFEDECGLGHGFVSRISRNVRKASLDKIKLKFPQVNIGWIKSGRGEMFCDVAPTEEASSLMERLDVFCRTKKISRNEFVDTCGLYKGFFKKASDSLQSVTLEKIHLAYPDLNLDWLLNGNGEILLSSEEQCDFKYFSSYKDRLRLFITKLGISESFFIHRCGFSRVRLSLLPDYPNEREMDKIANVYPQLNITWVRTGEGPMMRNDVISIDGSNVHTIPLVPQVAYKSYITGCSDTNYISTLPTIPFITEGEANYIAFEVNGNAMDDGSSRAYQNGDIVICKEISLSNLKTVGFAENREYLFICKENIYFKAVKGISFTTNIIDVRSYNPTYANFSIGMDSIRQIFVVEYQHKSRKG